VNANHGILIVGGVAGGMSAAARLRRLDEYAEIVIFERGPDVSFANCGLPYYIGGEIAERGKLLVQTPDRLRATMNLDIRPRHEVIRIDPATRTIDVRNLSTEVVSTERYDDLILSPGAAPIVPPIPGIDREGHFAVRSIPDVDRIDAWIKTKNARTAVVAGGGYIGIEMAEQLHRRGLTVTIVERLPQVLAPFDPEMAALVHAEMRKHGVALHLNDGVATFDSPASNETAAASVVVLAGGTRIPADLVILALGVRPESQLAKAAGLALGSTGGIRVNDRMQTSDPHIWAVGDAVEIVHGVTGKPSLIALGGPANRQGRIVADNIAGRDSRYAATFGTAIVRVFDVTAACTGASETLLKKEGIAHRIVHLHPNSHAGYYPGAQPIALKLMFAPDSGKVLGAQAVGIDGVDKRIDVIATALKAGLSVHDLADLELCYAPPFGSAKDPVNLAGMAAQNVLAGLVETVQWNDVAAYATEGAVILDVREAKERDGGTIPGSRGIPLGQLRGRLSELPKDKLLLVHCASGQRSYNACRLLVQHGFTCRNLTGSYKTWKAGTGGPS
jgi:NADPH-dependent 2,4-dienoyl-CoA reductase/sulfur reductase-like enzyme/rhodanese-related sulfurtransferase